MKSSNSAFAITMAAVVFPLTSIATPLYIRRSSVESDTSNAATTAEPALSPEPTPACTTLHRFGGFHLGPTSTVYATTATETVTLDCGVGCSSVAVDYFGGHGPIADFKTTVTETEIPTTIKEFVCGSPTALVTGTGTFISAATTTTSATTTAAAATITDGGFAISGPESDDEDELKV